MSSNEKIVRENMEHALREIAEDNAREFAEKARENTVKRLEKNVQGEEGLVNYISEVKQDRDSRGRFMDSFSFEIDHPTAKLHERGGPIEPTYGRAMTQGWDRDGFYDALEDCEYMVKKKRYLRSAMLDTMREFDN